MEHKDIIAVLESVKRREIQYNDKNNTLCTNPSESLGAKAIDAAIAKLATYEDAEEQGRLVVLPCKVGDSIYMVYDGYDEPVKKIVRGFNHSIYGSHGCLCQIDDIGRIAFLTRQEAKAALRERQGE